MSKVSLPPVRVEAALLQNMQRISAACGMSVYQLTRLAVQEYVERYSDAANPKDGS